MEARRITGPHLLLDGPGAALELGDEDPDALLARALSGAVRLGWDSVGRIRRHRSGSTVALTAPPDQLYTACALLEWAWGGAESPDWEAVEAEQQQEQNPRLLACLAHSPSFSDDDFGFTLGLGVHSTTWPLDALPEPEALGQGQGIPLVFLTGTNGKTTTTRLLTRIAMAAGFRPGWTSSDAYGVGTDIVETGDWTGPGAARRVLRHPEVDFGCLETARGGLLRRGLVIGGAQVAVVTNVSADHLGEWGIHTVADMADAKLGVAYGLAEGGVLVLGDEPLLRAGVLKVLERRPDLEVRWFGQDPALDCWADEEALHLGALTVPLDHIPLTFAGTARHNVLNAMAAALAARAAGLPDAAIVQGLAAVRPDAVDSHGRMNVFDLPDGSVAVVDFAHNTAGVSCLLDTVWRWPAERRLVLLGQAGDRTDAEIRDLAQVVARAEPDVIVVKHMEKYLRGRVPGEVVRLLDAHLREAGATAIVHQPSEAGGVAWMLAAARPGDLLVLSVHVDPDAVVATLLAAGAVPRL